MSTQTAYSKASWDSLPDALQDPLPEDHPWPQRSLLTLRIYSVPLQCEQVAMSVGHLKPGDSVEHHSHRDTEEIYLLMKGRAQINIDGEVIDARELDAFRLAPETPRSVYNNSDEDCYWIFVGAPVDELLEWIAEVNERADEDAS